jgi:hypothetical protein
MKQPTFFIAGAPRCGTTALYQYLNQHPQIFMSKVKELSHFVNDFPNVHNIFEKIMRFIGVQSDGQKEFSPINARFKNRSRLMAALFLPPQFIYKPFMKFISLFGVNFMKSVSVFYNHIEKINVTEAKKEPLDPVFRKELQEYFKQDMEKLSTMLGRDLSERR